MWAVLIAGLVVLVLDAFESAHGKSRYFLVAQAQCLEKTVLVRQEYMDRWGVNERAANFDFCNRGLIQKYTGTVLMYEEYVGIDDRARDSSDFWTPLIIPPENPRQNKKSPK